MLSPRVVPCYALASSYGQSLDETGTQRNRFDQGCRTTAYCSSPPSTILARERDLKLCSRYRRILKSVALNVDHCNELPGYQRGFLAGIEQGGRPVIATGRSGTMELVRHLRKGGFLAILLDEKYAEGATVPFPGLSALTSTAPAALALKHDLPLVPAYGKRRPDGAEFDVEFEAPIPHSDALKMTKAVNDGLSARVLDNPGQWYWMLRRWTGA
ncbi:lysophospholipid acyltransferase family protein [Roseovarius tibetensis]|uniref:lysophospholipid acyltransferase family protein n=1 Tax=Roseovarius tibetensis TaxID=2685897 RepID=UPI003D7F81E5